ncbi:ARL14 effector protein [Venturia canescens]|uniref:ARL14 effector protein n=1 Tax=Venturia canescens TaxID=32260 RepID=UPI001C9BE410|nr:ARL14 effector protein [Venturia canescens]XP_043270131.1 ARL14 effector protein [Venturia canescens]
MNSGAVSTERSTRSSRLRGVDSNTKKFLSDFDPQRSEREKRKLNRRLYPNSKKYSVYDERGFMVKTGYNLCDCLQLDCAGCHFPCAKCGSTKCGHECRNFRKWTYDTIENEGSDVIIKNPSLRH